MILILLTLSISTLSIIPIYSDRSNQMKILNIFQILRFYNDERNSFTDEGGVFFDLIPILSQSPLMRAFPCS